MSLRYEQYNALKITKDFLRRLAAQPIPKVSALRAEALRCLHHYPFLHDNGQPMWSKDTFTEDVT